MLVNNQVLRKIKLQTSFSVLVEQNPLYDIATGIVLSLELTYNGARDLYASMEQQIQPLNFKSKLSLLPSLDTSLYYKKLNF